MNGGRHTLKNLTEETQSTTEIFKGNVIALEIDTVRLPNGETATREIIRHPGAVAILAITTDKKMVFVEQYRKPVGAILFEIPAGKIDAGETNPLVTAKRELEEETDYRAEKWQRLTALYTAPGFADEVIHIYEATKLTIASNALKLDDDEFLNVHLLSLDEAKQLIGSQKIVDAKTVFAIQHFELNYNNY